MLFYLGKGDWKTGLEFLYRSAEQGCELAYGDIGSILYNEKNMIDEAVQWFRKATARPAAKKTGILKSDRAVAGEHHRRG